MGTDVGQAMAACRRVRRHADRAAIAVVWGIPALLVVLGLRLAIASAAGHLTPAVGFGALMVAGFVAGPVLWTRARPQDVGPGVPLLLGVPDVRDAIDRALVLTGFGPGATVRVTLGGAVVARGERGSISVDLGLAWVATAPPDVLVGACVRAIGLAEAGAGGRRARLVDAELERVRQMWAFGPARWWSHRMLSVLERMAARADARREAAAAAVCTAALDRGAYDDTLRWLDAQARFATYWQADVVPCIERGLLPPVLEGWRECLGAGEEVVPVPGTGTAATHEQERDVVAAVVPAADDLVETEWTRATTAVWMPRARSWLDGWQDALAPFRLGDLAETLLEGCPVDVDPYSWAEVVAVATTLGLVDERGCALDVRPWTEPRIGGDGWSFAPFALCVTVLENRDEIAAWEAFAREAGIDDLVVGGPMASAVAEHAPSTVGALVGRPRQVLDLAPPRRRRTATTVLFAGGLLGLACVAYTVGAFVVYDGLAARVFLAGAGAASAAGTAFWVRRRAAELRRVGAIVVEGEALVVEHPGVLKAPFVIPRTAVRLVVIDDGEWFDDRRLPVTNALAAAGAAVSRDDRLWLWRREGSILPQLGAGPIVPNLAVLVDDAHLAPQMRRITMGGPLPGEAAIGYLLEVADVPAARRALADWSVLRPGGGDDADHVITRYFASDDDAAVGDQGRIASERESSDGGTVHHLPVGTPRDQLLRRRDLRNAWICVVGGLIIPFLALGGAVLGWAFRRRDGGGHLPLILCGIAVFVVRYGLYWY